MKKKKSIVSPELIRGTVCWWSSFSDLFRSGTFKDPKIEPPTDAGNCYFTTGSNFRAPPFG